MGKRVLLIVVFLLPLTVFDCSQKPDLALAFFNKNKDNSALLAFDAVHISPARGLYVIKLFNFGGIVFRVESFSTTGDPQLVLNSGHDNFQKLKVEYKLDPDAAMQYLTNLFSTFSELKVDAVFGMPGCKYIEFVLDPHNVIVYVPDPAQLSERMKKDLGELEAKAGTRYDNNWFAYKLEKPFSY